MNDKQEPLIQVIEQDGGDIEIIVDPEQYRPIMASLSQAMCGAFDVAGEHEKIVFRTIRELTLRGREERERKRLPFSRGN